MKVSIKELYNKFKSTADSSLQAKLGKLYTEAVEAAFKESKPVILNPDLEYIISSSRGLQLFNEFVEQNGIPIVEVDRVRNILDHRKQMADQSRAISKNKNKQIVFEQYQEAINKLDTFKHKWEPAFMMFEYYKPKFDKCDYSKIYYEYAINKQPNSTKLLNRYGLGIVPDLVIFNHNYLKNNTILENIMTSSIFFDKTAIQWLYESVEPYSHSSQMYQYLEELSYNTELKELYHKERKNFFESAINLTFETSNIFTKDDIKIVQDFIKFKEAAIQLTTNPIKINQIRNEIANAQVLQTNLEDSAVLAFDYLAQPVKENIFVQSSDKKPGNIPDYIKKNYDTDYDGNKEDEEEQPPTSTPTDNTDNGMDAYKRTQPEPKYDEPVQSEPKTSKGTDDDGKQINYYYYNYSHSFNKDNSLKYSKDDNSLRYSDKSKSDSSVNYSDNSKHGSVEYSDSKQIGNTQHNVNSHNQTVKKVSDNSSGKDLSHQYSKDLDIDKSKNKTQINDMKDNVYKKDSSTNKTQTAEVKDNSIDVNADEKSKNEKNKDKKDEPEKKEETTKSQIEKDVKDVKKHNNKDNKEKKESCNTFLLGDEYFF